jgi:phosphopantothenoylcysteine decarboxylase
VLISTGSVASVKIPNIVSELRADGNVEVQVVSTDASLHFFDRDAVEAANPSVRVWTDSDEWSDWAKIGDPILHIELRRWADLVVIAPVSADMLAKMAAGLCDNLPLSLLRALSPDTPVVLCPAMNTFMYEHQLTARHLAFVRSVLGYYVLGPQGAGRLACGDVGAGKMTEWKDIVAVILGYAAAFRNRPENDSSILQALLSGATLDLTPNDDMEIDTTPSVVAAPTRIRDTVLPRQAPSLVAAPRAEPEVIHVKHSPKPRRRRPTFTSVLASLPRTLLSYLLFPLLLVLHALFTVSSIILRVVQSRPEPLPELTKPAPAHLGLILVPGSGPRALVRERYIESVRRAVVWAGEWGVETISVWDGQGLGVQHHAAVTSSLLDLPLSPPSSNPPSPPHLHSEIAGTLGDETVTKSVYVNTRKSRKPSSLNLY